MKTSHRYLATLLTAGALSIGSIGLAHAWGGPGGPGGCNRGGNMMQMAQVLDLTDQQKQAIRSIRDQHRDAMQSQRDQMMDIRESLRTLVHSDAYDAKKVQELADAKAKVQAEITVLRADTMHKIRGELTPEQAAKFDSMKGGGFGRGGFRPSRYGPGGYGPGGF